MWLRRRSRARRKNTLSAHEQYELLVGEIGIEHRTALEELKLWQILGIIRGYRRKDIGAWRRTRWQTWVVLCAMGAKNLTSPDDLLELPGDGEAEEHGEISDEEYEASLELIRKANAERAGSAAREPAGADHGANRTGTVEAGAGNTGANRTG